MIYFLAVFALCLNPATSNWLTASVFTDYTCTSGEIGEGIIPAGKCLVVPDTLPNNITVPFKSAKFDCTSNSDGSVTLNVYAYVKSSDCSSITVPVPVNLDAGCQNGIVYTCGTTSQAVANNWPAIAGYQGDSTCSSQPAVVVGFVPNACLGGTTPDGSKQGSETVSMTDSTLNANVWASTDCSGDTIKTESVPINQCAPLPASPSTNIADKVTRALHASFSKIPHGDAMIAWLFVPASLQNPALYAWAGNAASVPGLQ